MEENNKLCLGFHYHVPAEHRDDGIDMPGYLACFIEGLAAECQQVVCFLHTPRLTERELLDCRIQASNVELVSIGPHSSVPQRVLMARRFVAPLAQWRGQLDALLIRGPSPLLPAFAHAAHRLGIPTALLLVGSYVDGIDYLPQPRGRKVLIRWYSHFNQWQQDAVARRSLTFVNSRRLFERLQGRIPHLVETRTTTLSDQDFFERADTCQQTPIRLLYTGRFNRGKGLLDIVQALAQLVAQGYDVVFDLVGWPEPSDPIMDDLMALATRLGVTERVINHGRKSLGAELFAYYRQADIYVIASNSNFEGFPRTIWEAMANSLPVVATSVGSIPQFVGEAAVIVLPAQPETLAKALIHLLETPAYRQALINKGLLLAQGNTLKNRCSEMIKQLNGYI